MTPAQRLIVRKMQEAIEEGYDAGTALVRVSQQTGVDRKRVLKAWIAYRQEEQAVAE